MKKFTGSLIQCLILVAFILTSATAQPSTLTVPLIEDGQAQIIEAFQNPEEWIRHDLWVETDFDTDGDGNPDRMYVSVTRPAQTENGDLKLPVIYETSPYYAGTARPPYDFFWDVKQELGEDPPVRKPGPEIERRGERPIISNSHTSTWVPRGFIVVHSTSPGTGLSDGSPSVGGENEALAPKAVIDWLNGRANGYTTRDGDEEVEAFWTNGNVGMTGTSYNGFLPFAAATTGVDGLKAIIPVAPVTSFYMYYRSNGLVRSPGGYLGEDADVLYDFVHSGDEAKREYNNRTMRDGIMAEGLDRKNGDYNDFWEERDYLKQMENYKAATLMAHAFNDWNVMTENSYQAYEKLQEMGVPSMVYYHQGGHGGEPPHELMNKWFTRYLFEVENGVEDLERSWIVRERDERENPTPYENYPHPAASPVTFHLTSGAPERGGLTLSQPESQGNETLVDNYSFTGSALAQAEWTDHRLIYLTPELQDSVHISGVPSVSVTLASSKPAANLTVWLVSLPWNEGRNSQITDNIITRGWASPQNRNSLRESEPLEPGEFYTVEFDLQPDDQIIPYGQQIGLLIFSSDKEYTLWPQPGTELTIDLDNTTLTLPVVNGRDALSGMN
ncbi:Xaa-Pro dipeptidyl-peptidase [Rhodohalobacter barkolensis]|uniref:Xaa-Pro dipeptidyl-peptidase n=1 Tax=Rhodohalobacter barkolensis TaxID=2053187 RepID=A0A2N0VL72_9BACT|nr:Xaa-Pro dipeptidyl-peptidase [Rhodohalobacter barkolensis]PKD44945.1 Xaa-Pro dipeptidyl-peptidase [Rhodohalobacter barkolensis]